MVRGSVERKSLRPYRDRKPAVQSYSPHLLMTGMSVKQMLIIVMFVRGVEIISLAEFSVSF